MALATSNRRISHAFFAFVACKKPKSQVSKKCEMMELRPNAAPGSARGAWICGATIYFPPSPKGSRYSLRNMSKGISASPQVRKLVSLYTGSKHYHTGKAASSVVIQLQGCSAKPSRPDSLGEGSPRSMGSLTSQRHQPSQSSSTQSWQKFCKQAARNPHLGVTPCTCFPAPAGNEPQPNRVCSVSVALPTPSLVCGSLASHSSSSFLPPALTLFLGNST